MGPLSVLLMMATCVLGAGSEAVIVNRDGTLHSQAPFAAHNISAHDVSATTVTAKTTLMVGNTTLDEATLRAFHVLLQGYTTTITATQGTCGVQNCSVHAVCNDSIQCVCLPGYRGNGTVCEMINACGEDTHECSRDGSELCLMTAPGAYRCACAVGYAPDTATTNHVCVVKTVRSDGRLLKVHETSDSTHLLGAELDEDDYFGSAVAHLGDLDGE